MTPHTHFLMGFLTSNVKERRFGWCYLFIIYFYWSTVEGVLVNRSNLGNKGETPTKMMPPECFCIVRALGSRLLPGSYYHFNSAAGRVG